MYITSLVVAAFLIIVQLVLEIVDIQVPLVLLHTMVGRTIIKWCKESQSE